jgi:hypothetical protein
VLQIDVTIEGTTPLLCNRFSDANADAATSGSRASTTGDKGTPREQAEHKLYVGIRGDLMIPQPNVLRCIIDAGIYFKIGKRQVTTQKSSIIPACVDVEGVEIAIAHAEPWQVDTRAVRIPSTGGRVLCHRPRFDDWQLSFAVTLDTAIMAPKLFREVMDAAGRRIGLGDFRPACKGPFGKFVISAWQATDPSKSLDGRAAVGVA